MPKDLTTDDLLEMTDKEIMDLPADGVHDETDINDVPDWPPLHICTKKYQEIKNANKH